MSKFYDDATERQRKRREAIQNGLKNRPVRTPTRSSIADPNAGANYYKEHPATVKPPTVKKPATTAAGNPVSSKRSLLDTLISFSMRDVTDLQNKLADNGGYDVGDWQDISNKMGALFSPLPTQFMEGAMNPNAKKQKVNANDNETDQFIKFMDNWNQDAGANFTAGIGDLAKGTGDTMQWLGTKDGFGGKTMKIAGKKVSDFAQTNVIEPYERPYNKPFGWNSLLDPDWYSSSIARSMPFTISMFIPSLFGAKAVGAVAESGKVVRTLERFGVGDFGKAVIRGLGYGLGGQAVSTPFESAFEAGNVFDDAIKKGHSPEAANQMADRTFWNNMKLLGITSVPEMMAIFMPGTKAAGSTAKALGKTAGRLGVAGGLEAAQEAGQEVISAHAKGEKVDPAAFWESAAAGGVMGLGMGAHEAVSHFKEANPLKRLGNGDPVVAVQNEVRSSISDQLRADTDALEAHLREQGFSEEEIQAEVFDEIARHPEGQQKIVEATQRVAAQVLGDSGVPQENVQQNLADAMENVIMTSAKNQQSAPTQEQTPEIPMSEEQKIQKGQKADNDYRRQTQEKSAQAKEMLRNKDEFTHTHTSESGAPLEAVTFKTDDGKEHAVFRQKGQNPMGPFPMESFLKTRTPVDGVTAAEIPSESPAAQQESTKTMQERQAEHAQHLINKTDHEIADHVIDLMEKHTAYPSFGNHSGIPGLTGQEFNKGDNVYYADYGSGTVKKAKITDVLPAQYQFKTEDSEQDKMTSFKLDLEQRTLFATEEAAKRVAQARKAVYEKRNKTIDEQGEAARKKTKAEIAALTDEQILDKVAHNWIRMAGGKNRVDEKLAAGDMKGALNIYKENVRNSGSADPGGLKYSHFQGKARIETSDNRSWTPTADSLFNRYVRQWKEAQNGEATGKIEDSNAGDAAHNKYEELRNGRTYKMSDVHPSLANTDSMLSFLDEHFPNSKKVSFKDFTAAAGIPDDIANESGHPYTKDNIQWTLEEANYQRSQRGKEQKKAPGKFQVGDLVQWDSGKPYTVWKVDKNGKIHLKKEEYGQMHYRETAPNERLKKEPTTENEISTIQRPAEGTTDVAPEMEAAKSFLLHDREMTDEDIRDELAVMEMSITDQQLREVRDLITNRKKKEPTPSEQPKPAQNQHQEHKDMIDKSEQARKEREKNFAPTHTYKGKEVQVLRYHPYLHDGQFDVIQKNGTIFSVSEYVFNQSAQPIGEFNKNDYRELSPWVEAKQQEEAEISKANEERSKQAKKESERLKQVKAFKEQLRLVVKENGYKTAQEFLKGTENSLKDIKQTYGIKDLAELNQVIDQLNNPYQEGDKILWNGKVWEVTGVTTSDLLQVKREIAAGTELRGVYLSKDNVKPAPAGEKASEPASTENEWLKSLKIGQTIWNKNKQQAGEVRNEWYEGDEKLKVWSAVGMVNKVEFWPVTDLEPYENQQAQETPQEQPATQPKDERPSRNLVQGDRIKHDGSKLTGRFIEYTQGNNGTLAKVQVDNSNTTGFWPLDNITKIEDTQPTVPAAESDRPTMTINEELNGVELKFPGKPSDEVIAYMKANKFRWNGKKKVWYAKRNGNTEGVAAKLSGSTDPKYQPLNQQESKAPEPNKNKQQESTEQFPSIVKPYHYYPARLPSGLTGSVATIEFDGPVPKRLATYLSKLGMKPKSGEENGYIWHGIKAEPNETVKKKYKQVEDYINGVQAEPKQETEYEKPFFSTTGKADEIEALNSAQPENVLIAFNHFWNKDSDEFNGKKSPWDSNLWDGLLSKLNYKPKQVILDSGAINFHNENIDIGFHDLQDHYVYYEYSEHQISDREFDNGVVDQDGLEQLARGIMQDVYQDWSATSDYSPIYRYIAHLQRAEGNYQYAFNLDEIGDNGSSYLIFRLLNEMFPGKIIPVFSGIKFTTDTNGAAWSVPVKGKEGMFIVPETDFTYLDKYAKLVDYIGIGGTAIQELKDKRDLRAKIINNITNQYPDKKFHVLGTLDKRVIDKTNSVFSSDGTAWIDKHGLWKKNGKANKAEQSADNITRMENNLTPKQETPANVQPNKYDIARSRLDKLAANAEKYLKDNKDRMNSLPLDLYAAAAIVGAKKIANGVIDFTEWSEQMLTEYGSKLRLSLRSLYTQSEDMVNFSDDDWDEYLASTGTEFLDKEEAAPAEPTQSSEEIQQQWKEMKKKMASLGTLTGKNQVKHMEAMKDFADKHGLEWTHRMDQNARTAESNRVKEEDQKLAAKRAEEERKKSDANYQEQERAKREDLENNFQETAHNTLSEHPLYKKFSKEEQKSLITKLEKRLFNGKTERKVAVTLMDNQLGWDTFVFNKEDSDSYIKDYLPTRYYDNKIKDVIVFKNYTEGANDNEVDGNHQGTMEKSPAGEVQGTSTDGAIGEGSESGGRRNDGRSSSDVFGVETNQSSTSEQKPANGNQTQQHANETSGGTESAADSRKRQPRPVKSNFIITDELDNLGGAKTKFKGNIAALRLLHELETSERNASSDEQKILARYVGWGGLANAFNKDSKGWMNEYDELKSLVDDGIITQKEYETARKTTQYAHYTAKVVVDKMYQALEQMGFKGGRILEPSLGTGNFFGLLPKSMRNSTLNGVEMDPLSGRIAQQLYQKAHIEITPFQDFKIADGYFDVAIGNPPYSDLTLKYGKEKHRLHNYFFIKSLDKVREGGILAFITSSGSMNSIDKSPRIAMEEKADFLGAIRLPGDAFKENAGTEVTADILFFQKRKIGEAPNHRGDFIETYERTVKDRNGDDVTVRDNEYFLAHPEMVLGEATTDKLTGKRLGIVATSGNIEDKLQQALTYLPKDIYEGPTSQVEEVQYAEEVKSNLARDLDEMNFGYENGAIVQKVNGKIIKRDDITGNKLDRVAAAIRVRDAAKALLLKQYETGSDDEIKGLMKKLNQEYDRFILQYKELNSQYNISTLKQDPLTLSLLMSLEKEDNGQWVKQDIFKERVISFIPEVKNVSTPQEALVASLFKNGRIDLEYMSKLLGKPEADIISELGAGIFNDPIEGWVTADEYLSGNVRVKLAQAKKEAMDVPAFERNVKALEAVIPEDIPSDDIFVQFGAPFIPDTDVQDFINQFIGDGRDKVKVTFVPTLGSWLVKGTRLHQTIRNTEEFAVFSDKHGGSSFNGVELVESLLNNKDPKITYEVGKNPNGDAIREVDQEATALARQKAKELEEHFQDWLWSDPEREQRLVRKYNDEFNSVILQEHDGSIIYGGDTEETNKPIPGFNNIKYILKPHQKNVVWRMIQGGNALLAHVVGAGKTLEMIVAGMEMKRLGLIKKPAYVVPPSLTEQWDREFRDAYPNAKILMLTNDLLPSVSTVKGQDSKEIPLKGDINQYLNIGDKFSVKGDTKKYTFLGTNNGKIQGFTSKKNVTVNKHGVILTVKGNHKVDPAEVDIVEFKRNEIAKSHVKMTDEAWEEKKNEHRINRAAALNRIAVGNYDAIIISHETFKRLSMSAEAYQEFIREQIEELELALQALEEENGNDNKLTIKQLEKVKESLEEKLTSSLDEENKDIAIPFEQLGIDQLFVDEGHKFKNLGFQTKMTRISGLSNTDAKRSTDMFVKTRWLTRARNGKGVVFATGTPISNTMAELYSMMRYLQWDRIKGLAVTHFDSWANMFGQTETSIEMDVAGGFKERTRFKKFKNIRELMRLWKEVADIKTAPMLNLPRPKNTEFKEIITQMTEEQQAYFAEIVSRANALEGGGVDPKEDNWLKLTGDARRMSLDIRLAEPTAKDNPGSKINSAVKEIFRVWEEGKAERPDKHGNPVNNLAQLVFADLGTPKEKAQNEDGEDVDNADEQLTFDVYNDIRRKLVQRGIPIEQIAFIHEAKTKKKKDQLFKDVRAGKVRILIGSTEKMGAGMNVQERLVALHHIDAPWRPSDVEQREGRMIRQGNRLDHVTTYTYVTEGSFDRIMWDMLKNKASFIEQLMNNSDSINEMEDLGAMELRFAHISAVSAGDNTIIEKMNVDNLVRDLRNAKEGHRKAARKRKTEIATLPETIESWKKEVAKSEKDAAKLAANENEGLKIDGQIFAERKDLAAALDAKYRQVKKSATYGNPVKLASLSGFDVMLEASLTDPNVFKIYLNTEYKGNNDYNYYNEQSAIGTVNRIENLTDKITQHIRSNKSWLDSLEKKLQELKDYGDPPFKKEAELQEALNKQRELDARMLNMERPGTEPQGDSTIHQELENRINESIPGYDSMGILPQMPFQRDRRPGKAPKRKYSLEDDSIQTRIDNAEEIPKEPISAVIKDWLGRQKRRITREFEHLPNTAEWSPIRHKLLQLEKTRGVAMEKTARSLQALLTGFNRDQYELFRNAVLLSDMMKEKEAGHALAFGFTEEKLNREYNRIKDFLKSEPRVAESINLRKRLWAQIKWDYIRAFDEIGVDVKDKFSKEDYYRHIVIQKAQENQQGGKLSGSKALKTPKGKGYMKQRHGSDLDYVTDYLLAESEVMSNMLFDLEVARTIKLVDTQYNIERDLKKQVDEANDASYNTLVAMDEKEFERRAELEDSGMSAEEADAIIKKEGGYVPDRVKNVLQEYIQTYSLRLGKNHTSQITAVSQAIKGRVGWAYAELKKLAENEELWTGDKGEYENLVEELGKEDGNVQKEQLFEYLSDLLTTDNEGAKWAGMYLKYTRLQPTFRKDVIGEKNYKTVMESIPEGYRVWRPDDGNLFYMADTLPQYLAERLFNGTLDTLTEGDFTKQMVMAGKKKGFIIKDELAETLDHLMEPPKFSTMKNAMKAIKQVLLIGPTTAWKYNVRNMTGDLDKVVGGNPSTLNPKILGRAAMELQDVFLKGRAPSGNLKQWVERGGVQTLIQSQEFGEIKHLRIFKDKIVQKELNTLQKTVRIPKATWDFYWNNARKLTDYRESLLRYATFLSYLEQIEQNNGKPKNYGASIREEIDALPNKYDKAFNLSNDLLIPYDKTSAKGRELRDGLFPFFSFIEGNIRSYVRLFKNAYHDEELAKTVGRKMIGTVAIKTPMIAYRTGKLVMSVSFVTVLLALFNNLFFPDEEDELPEDVKRSVHIVLGRNDKGKVVYFNRLGTLQDFLEWFGLDDLPLDVRDVLNNDKTLLEVIGVNALKPVNKVVQAVNPIYKQIVEQIAGVKFFPDFTSPTKINDHIEHFMSLFALDKEYAALRDEIIGRPHKPYKTDNLVAYSIDPDEANYYNVRDKAQKAAEKFLGKAKQGYMGDSTPKSEALYEMKLGLKYNDIPYAEQKLKEYAALGGTQRGLDASLNALHPLHSIPKDYWQDYIDSLKPKDQQKVKWAIEYYEQTLRGAKYMK